MKSVSDTTENQDIFFKLNKKFHSQELKSIFRVGFLFDAEMDKNKVIVRRLFIKKRIFDTFTLI